MNHLMPSPSALENVCKQWFHKQLLAVALLLTCRQGMKTKLKLCDLREYFHVAMHAKAVDLTRLWAYYFEFKNWLQSCTIKVTSPPFIQPDMPPNVCILFLRTLASKLPRKFSSCYAAKWCCTILQLKSARRYFTTLGSVAFLIPPN